MLREMNIKGFESFVKDASSKMAVAARRGARIGALRCIPMVHTSVRTAISGKPGGSPPAGGAVNTGAYLQGFSAVETGRGAAIVNSVGYSDIIEGGRRTGARTPPREAIARWAQRRLGMSREEALRAAFPMARAIARRGLQPRKVVGGIINKLAVIVRDEIAKEILKTLGGGAE